MKPKTSKQWKQQFRRIKAGEKPVGFLTVTTPTTVHHEEIAGDGTITEWTSQETKTKKVGVYNIEQTVKYTRPCGTVYRTLFTSYFISSRQKYIWRTEKSWVTCKGYLDDKKIRAHIEGKEIYGVRSGEYTRCLAIDLDLHNGCKKVFLAQLRAIMERFHGCHKVHYSISRSGVHIIIMLEKETPIDYARNWLRKELESLDSERLKELAARHNMRTLSNIEIKPGKNDGWRLPFARGRITYVDEPLEGNEKATFERYIYWLAKPTYASVGRVFSYISRYVQVKRGVARKKKAPREAVVKKDVILGSLGKMKRRYRKVLVDAWNGRLNPADSLNTLILVTARMSPYYYDDADAAIDYIEELVDDLPNTDFSDRLSTGNRKEVSRVIRATVDKAFDGNGGQPEVEKSNVKLAATKQAWDRVGFDLTDRSTWERASASLGKYINFAPEHMKPLSDLAEILKVDLETCANATRQVLRVVHTERELSISYFGKLLRSFGVHARHDGRVSEYVQGLIKLGWIVMIKQYWAEHRARTYTAGDEFSGKVRSTTTQSNHPPEPIISVPFYIAEDDLALAMGKKTPQKPAELNSKPPPWAVTASSAC